MQRAALALLSQRLTQQTRSCLLPSLKDSDTQTRWVVRRALTIATAKSSTSLPAPVGGIRSDGLVAKSPAQLGTLTATYNAARALTASAQQEQAPDWLKKRLKQLGSDPELDPSDRVLLAMTCHRLSLACGPQAEKGVKEAAELKVPARVTGENQRSWYGALAARAEFGLGCRRTSVDDAVVAARFFVERGLPALLVLDADRRPYAIVPGSQLLRVLVPDFALESPAPASSLRDSEVEPLGERLDGLTVAQWLPRHRALPTVVGPDAGAAQVAALMRTHTPLVAVVESDGEAVRTVGAITAARLMGCFLA